MLSPPPNAWLAIRVVVVIITVLPFRFPFPSLPILSFFVLALPLVSFATPQLSLFQPPEPFQSQVTWLFFLLRADSLHFLEHPFAALNFGMLLVFPLRLQLVLHFL